MKRICSLLYLLAICLQATAQDYWKPVVSGTNKHLYSISFADPLNGFIGGSDSTLLKSADGGFTWAPIATTGMRFSTAHPDIIDLKFVDANTGFAIVSNRDNLALVGAAYKTTNGGLSWTNVPAAMSVCAAYYFDANNGYLVGSGFFSGCNIAKYTGGVAGDPAFLSTSSADMVLSVAFLDTMTGIAGTNSGFVFRTFNGGKTWDTVKTNVDTSIYGFQYVNDSTIIAVTANVGFSMIISKDRGATWHLDPMSMTFYYPVMRDIALSRKDSLIYVGNSAMGEGIIFYQDLAIQTFKHALHSIGLRNDSVAFVVGDSGQIVSNARSILSTVDPKSPALEASVFPNPGTGVFTSKMNQLHTVTVYDLHGRSVWSQAQAATQHSIDLQGQPKGFYIVALRTSSPTQVLYSRITLQ
jgi:photosystem II stability/assembly factor-like uncharacterized protein